MNQIYVTCSLTKCGSNKIGFIDLSVKRNKMLRSNNIRAELGQHMTPKDEKNQDEGR